MLCAEDATRTKGKEKVGHGGRKKRVKEDADEAPATSSGVPLLKREASVALGPIEGSPESGGTGGTCRSPSSVGSIIPPELLSSFTSAMGDGAPLMGMLKNLSLNLGTMNLGAMAAGMGASAGAGEPGGLEDACRCAHCLKCSCGRDDRPCCSMDAEGFMSKLLGCKHSGAGDASASASVAADAISPVSGSYAMDISAMRQDEAVCAPGGGACLPPLLSQLIADQFGGSPKIGNPTPVPTPSQLSAGDASSSCSSTGLANARLLSEAAEFIQRQSESSGDSATSASAAALRQASLAAAGAASATAAAAMMAMGQAQAGSPSAAATAAAAAAAAAGFGGAAVPVCSSSEQLLRSAAAGHAGFLADERLPELPRRVLCDADVELLAMLRQSYEAEFNMFSSDDNALKGQPSITALMNIVGARTLTFSPRAASFLFPLVARLMH